MNDKQKQILKLLWNYQSLREEHISKLCNCTENDINCLIASKAIEKDKDSKIIRYNNRKIDNRNIAAFDVVMEYLDRKPKIKKGKHPVTLSMKTDYFTYDIIAIKEAETDALFKKIDEVSKAERVIIVIETKEYIKKVINTKRPCYICIYEPLEIVDKINYS